VEDEDFWTRYIAATPDEDADFAPRRPISPVLWALLAMLLIGLAVAVIV